MEIFSDPEFWVGVGFALVIGLFLYLGVPAMVGAMLDTRAAAIAKELDEARKLREDAAALLEQYRPNSLNPALLPTELMLMIRPLSARYGRMA